MKKLDKSLILYIAMFVLGLGILLYPTMSNWWNTRVADSLINDYDSIVTNMDDSEREKLLEDARQFNTTLIGNIVPDAFAEGEANNPNAQYEALLNPTGSGLIGTIEVPKIHENLPIYHYTTTEVLEKGAGHLPGSSLPIGGDSTHSVITAHRGLPKAKMFTDLDKMEEKDVFYIHVLGEVIAYEVHSIKVVEPTNTKDLSIVEGKDLCTLLTCTPYSINSHRLLVTGHRIPYDPTQHDAAGSGFNLPKLSTLIVQILCVLLGILFALLVIVIHQIRENHKLEKMIKSRQMSLKNKRGEVK